MDKLLASVQEENAPQEKKSYVDERLWKPELDKSGTGSAVIRFLPAVDGEELPWVKVWKHAFQGPTGKWFIENSLTTLNQKDPVSEHNSELWNTGLESDKETARKQKRKLEYYSNIYVVSDPKHPENNGKVFLFRYGKKIFDKIMAAMQPEFEDETPINPFDFWEGANFKLKIRKVDGFWNYDKSEFDSVKSLSDDDGDCVWVTNIDLAPGSTGNYIFFNSPNGSSDWGTKENLNGQDCADPANYDDRILDPVGEEDYTLLHRKNYSYLGYTLIKYFLHHNLFQ